MPLLTPGERARFGRFCKSLGWPGFPGAGISLVSCVLRYDFAPPLRLSIAARPSFLHPSPLPLPLCCACLRRGPATTSGPAAGGRLLASKSRCKLPLPFDLLGGGLCGMSAPAPPGPGPFAAWARAGAAGSRWEPLHAPGCALAAGWPGWAPAVGSASARYFRSPSPATQPKQPETETRRLSDRRLHSAWRPGCRRPRTKEARLLLGLACSLMLVLQLGPSYGPRREEGQRDRATPRLGCP